MDSGSSPDNDNCSFQMSSEFACDIFSSEKSLDLCDLLSHVLLCLSVVNMPQLLVDNVGLIPQYHDYSAQKYR
ncbi:MAG: hypothetical protein BWZ03_00225 [bacterium ADurb.BinA186]|nr:MAG: hypothetical protein BWZ03_00225 [bacterium ADurb.BinA186]